MNYYNTLVARAKCCICVKTQTPDDTGGFFTHTPDDPGGFFTHTPDNTGCFFTHTPSLFSVGIYKSSRFANILGVFIFA